MYETWRLKIRKFSHLSCLCLFFAISSSGWAQQLEVRDGFFYIDGEKLFVKGIGYEVSALPGEVPWEKTFNPGQLHFDIQRILSAGYNTIRTWAPFSDQELDLLQDYDIKIIMGIWVDPNGDFADPTFISQAKNTVSSVLSYSKNYDNIIAYLVMNEPLPETIFEAGYNETVQLWTQLINIIHAQHPGRPVSIANTCNGTYIDPGIFDFSAFNAYIYNPVTINYLHGYRDYVQYLNELNLPGHPLIVTEYGLSVSPTGPGNWGYGGNSLDEQQEGILHMYKSMVNGGASGSCVFNYSDGWWKAGNEFVHDDAVEEWFGLVNYTGIDDTVGELRPAWETVKTYQSAIITQPQSAGIYQDKVPVEVFRNDTIKRIEILIDDDLIHQIQASDSYYLDTLNFDTLEIRDIVLVFDCYNSDNTLVKSEEKSILVANKDISLPVIEITTNDDMWQENRVDVNYNITRSVDFTVDSELDLAYYPHVGFAYGQQFQTTMPEDHQVSVSRQYSIDPGVNVFTVGAAFDIIYHEFRKRIVNQATFSRFNILSAENTENNSVLIYPNPAAQFIYIANKSTSVTPYFNYTIYNNTGAIVGSGNNAIWNQSINISNLKTGLYHIRINNKNQKSSIHKKILVIQE